MGIIRIEVDWERGRIGGWTARRPLLHVCMRCSQCYVCFTASERARCMYLVDF